MKTPDQWRRWLSGFTREPEDRLAHALQAVDAFEALSAGQSTDEQALQLLVKAASSPHKLVFETGCHLLVHLAATQQNCQQAIERMASSQDSTARFHAIAYLNASLPESLRSSVIDRALSDRSSRVSAMAVQQAEEFGFKHLLPRLEDLIASEPRANVQKALALHVPLLRDGFLLAPDPDGSGYWLTVRRPGSIPTAFIPQDRFCDSYVKQAVEHLKKGELLS
jgi:hypothetical protein